MQKVLVEGAAAGIIRSAHDCAEGGLAVTIAECCFDSSHGVGIDVKGVGASAWRDVATLFGESASRAVVSAAYSFVSFPGGAVAPWAAGRLGEEVSIHAPFWMGAAAVAVAVVIMAVGAKHLRPTTPASHSADEAELVAAGDAS